MRKREALYMPTIVEILLGAYIYNYREKERELSAS
jgi:hypothetical protein